jgi:c-di-GMP-binding flagellar brake protein YcgR
VTVKPAYKQTPIERGIQVADGSRNVSTRPADNLHRLCGNQVSITFGKDDKQYFGSCLGVCPGKFFMTQVPTGPDVDKKLLPGNTAVIRFVESGMVCGFKAKIQLVLKHPFRLIFFNHPDVLEAINLRATKRVALFLDATIQKDGEDFEGAIRDLSAGGCLFVMNYWQDPFWDDLGMGTSLSIKFKMRGDKSPIELECKPVRIGKDKDELSMGLSFDGNPQELLDRVTDFITYASQFQESVEPK